MDGTLPSISAGDLAGIIGTAAAPIVIDVRSAVDLAVVDRLIPGSIHHPQSDVQDLRTRLPATRPIITRALHGMVLWKSTQPKPSTSSPGRPIDFRLLI